MEVLKVSIKYLLLATAITPLLVIAFLPYPYNFSKFLVFNILIEMALAVFLVYWLLSPKLKIEVRKIARSPLVIFLGLFLVSVVLSTIFAHSPYRAIWSKVERGDGLLGMLHLFVYFGLLLLNFDKKDWDRFFRVHLVVAAIMIFYAWLQFLGANGFSTSEFPFAMLPSSRPGAFFENGAYLASYLIFCVGVALLIFYRSHKKNFWRFFSLTVAILAALTIFLSNTRGAILGLILGGLVFLVFQAVKGGSSRAKKVSRVLIGAGVAFAILFLLTRGAGIWQAIPGLDRLANLGVNDLSFKTRLIALGSSVDAFLERPILGWGLENFNVAYNVHYNPEYQRYEEAWFDRAHNKLADVAVMQGGLGLVAYLGIFAALFLLIFKRGDRDDQNFKIVLAAMLVAYFVSNLFLFDTPASYLMFFGILAFIIIEFMGGVIGESPTKERSQGIMMVFGFGVVASVLGLGYLFYVYNYIPFSQAKSYRETVILGDASKVLMAIDKSFTPYSYVQDALRVQFLQLVSAGDKLKDSRFDFVTDKAIKSFEDMLLMEPDYDPRTYINLAGAYNERGKRDPVFSAKSEAALKKALELAPKRQDLYYLLAYALAGQKKYAEAIQVSREAVELDPEVAKAHYSLGLELAFAGQENWDEVEAEFAKALEIGFVNKGLLPIDYANMEIIYKQMLTVYVPARDRVRVVRIAERLKQISEDPVIKTDLDTVISLANKGDWGTLNRLLVEPLNN